MDTTPSTTRGFDTTVVVATAVVTVIDSRFISSSSTRTGSSSRTPTATSSSSSTPPPIPTGAIVGSAVGGTLALVVLAVCVWKLVQSYRAKDVLPVDTNFDSKRFASPHVHSDPSSGKLATSPASGSDMGELGIHNTGPGGMMDVAGGAQIGWLPNHPTSMVPPSQMPIIPAPYITHHQNVAPRRDNMYHPHQGRSQMDVMSNVPNSGYYPHDQSTYPMPPQRQPIPSPAPHFPNPHETSTVTLLPGPFAFDRQQPQRHPTNRTTVTTLSSDTVYSTTYPSSSASPGPQATISTSGCSSDGEVSEAKVREKQRLALAEFTRSSGSVEAGGSSQRPAPQPELIVHEDGGRLSTPTERRVPEEIPPSYESIKQDR
ncbi:hypothetical protein ONZ45_g18561 [Pleurotus djamor]|nr:hypothetical protein ONZ45_g18561 [Pleurotus djamor]